MARRRGVDDDQVEAAFVVELVELLHRHVLLRSRERPGDVAVEAVAEDAVRLLGVGRVAVHEPVEGGPGVEHQRGQPPLTGRLAVGIPAGPGDLAGRVAELGEPERVGEPLGGVDRHHHRVAAGPGRGEREHGGDRWSCRPRRCRSTPSRGAARRGRRWCSRGIGERVDPERRRVGERGDLGGVRSRRTGTAGELGKREPAGEAVGLGEGERSALGRGTSPAASRAAASGPSRRDARPRAASASADPVTSAAAGSGTALTTTGPSLTPTRSSSANAVSTSSFTGVSSASVTSMTRQRAGSESRSMTSWAWARTGPIRTASRSPRADSRKLDRMPGGRARRSRSGRRRRPVRAA